MPEQIQGDLLQAVKDAQTAAGIRERTRKAKKWLFNNVRELVKNNYSYDNRTNLLNQGDSISRNSRRFVGKMYMFLYDPKLKQQLPYYDRFPLIFILEIYKDGFLGINLHYLPPIMRLKLFNRLLHIANNRSFDETTRLKLSYETIKNFSKYRYAIPCIKRYLTSHIRSRMRCVPGDDWVIALFLPTESFKKKSMEVVWNDSRKIIAKQRSTAKSFWRRIFG